MRTVLIIGYVWPEPTSSAAGVRTWNLIQAFQSAGWRIYFASPSKENAFTELLRQAGIATFLTPANDPIFDQIIREIHPDYVIFDRFVTEEQFGWRVDENCPKAAKILDTQDLHFVRRARERAIRSGQATLEDVFDLKIELDSEDALREIASIYRSDLALVISGYELALLRNSFHLPQHLLHLYSLAYSDPKPTRSWLDRRDFAMIGNFRHPPNEDAVHWLHQEIWPEIRKALPDTTIHLYGAYPPKSVMELTNTATGFHVLGPVENAIETLSNYRVTLAPLRFGAGIKGKIADSWSAGAPVITTPIGAEGLIVDTSTEQAWGGWIARSIPEFVEKATKLYLNEALWIEKQKHGHSLLKRFFDQERNSQELVIMLEVLRKNLAQRRKENFIGRMLRHHLHKSTKYFSRWIELKESHRVL